MAYVKITNFAIKDSTNDVIRGTEHDDEYNAIAVAIGLNALKGANSDITSLSGLTTALSVTQGGTDATTASGARTNLGVTATGADTTYNYRANNLSDVASASTARTNLGLAIGTNVQAYNDNLQGISQGGYSAFKNRIINGAMNVWQRGTTYAVTSVFSYGSADRWAFAMGATAAGIANKVASGLTGFQYALKLGRNNASTSPGPIYAHTVIEQLNSISLQGKTVTLSFYAKAGANFSAASSVVTCLINTGTGGDSNSSPATFGSWTGNANVFQSNTITTSWARYSLTTTLGSSITNIGIQLTYSPSGTAGADDNVYITGVQLEEGSTATSFDYQPYGTELALCQRYYYRTPLSNIGSLGTVNVVNATTSVTSTPLPVQMRIAPTALEQSGTAGDYTVYTAGTGRACSSVVVFSTSTTPREGVCTATVASGQTAGQAGFIYSTASAGYLGWSAEL